MTGRFMDLRPLDVRNRVRDATERLRVARLAVVAGGLLSIAWGSGAWRLSVARADHQNATIRAENVVGMEAELAKMRGDLERSGRELAAWRTVTMPFDTGALIDSIVADLPASATLESLVLDAGSLIAIPAGGARRGEPTFRRVEGEIEGFAVSDEAVAALVDALRSRPFMNGVRVVTTRHRELTGEGEVAREFRVAFELDLEAASPAPVAAADSSEGESAR